MEIPLNMAIVSTPSTFPLQENKSKHTRHALPTLIPVILITQFSSPSNSFFLVLSLLQCIPSYRVISPLTSLLPILIILLISTIKECVSELTNYLQDFAANNEVYSVYRENKLLVVKSENIVVGDMVIVERNGRVPADLIILKTGTTDGVVFVRTEQLDGESEWKRRTASRIAHNLSFKELKNIFVEVGDVNGDFYDFRGIINIRKEERTSMKVNTESENIKKIEKGEFLDIKIDEAKKSLETKEEIQINDVIPCKQFKDELNLNASKKKNNENYNSLKRNSDTKVTFNKLQKSENLSIENTIWTNSILASSQILGIVIYTGNNTKTALNTLKTRTKISKCEKELNITIGILATVIIITSFVFTLISKSNKRFDIPFLRFLSVFSCLLPVSLRTIVEFARLIYVAQISQSGIVVRNTNLAEECGRVEFLMVDKTGTLTKNCMKMKKVVVGGLEMKEEELCELIGNEMKNDFFKNRSFYEFEDEKVVSVNDFESKNEIIEQVVFNENEETKNIFEDVNVLNANNEKITGDENNELKDRKPVVNKPNVNGLIQNKKYDKTDKNTILNIKNNNEDYKSLFPKSANKLEDFEFNNKDAEEHNVSRVYDETNFQPKNLLITNTDEKIEFKNAVSILGNNNLNISKSEFNKTIGNDFSYTYNDDIIKKLSKNNKTDLSKLASEFIIAISVCHSVSVENNEFVGSSPDEIAILKFAEKLGIRLISRNNNEILINTTKGIDCYKIIETYPFTPETKRMGMLIEINGTRTFYAKGADSVIGANNPWVKHFSNEYSKKGLRVLVMAKKEIKDKKFYGDECVLKIKNEYKNHSENQNIKIKNEKKESLFDNLTVLGVTAVEDSLQHGIVETLAVLKKSGVKIWMLTGDKNETSIAVAIAVGLIDSDKRLIINELKPEKIVETIQSIKNYDVIIINGQSIDVLGQDLDWFVQKASLIKCVIACRCTPAQKAKLTSKLSQNYKKIVAAIGDGGNDVAMITAAQVGIGIFGKEGTAASSSADYAVSNFSDVEKLLLFHGKNALFSSTNLSLFLIHRGALLFLIQFFFTFYNSFFPDSFFPGHLQLSLTFVALPPIFNTIFIKRKRKNRCKKFFYFVAFFQVLTTTLIFGYDLISNFVMSAINTFIVLIFYGFDCSAVWYSIVFSSSILAFLCLFFGGLKSILLLKMVFVAVFQILALKCINRFI